MNTTFVTLLGIFLIFLGTWYWIQTNKQYKRKFIVCPRCRGFGWSDSHTCSQCHGKGWIWK